MRFRLALGCLLALVFRGSLPAGEALWPVHLPPLEEIRKDWGFTPDEKWLQNVQRACVKVTPLGQDGGGSGAFVSGSLVITNRHVILDALAALSTPQRDLARDGFYAAAAADELACEGLEIQVLLRATDVTAKVKGALGDNPSPEELARVSRSARAEPGLRNQLVSYYGGAQHWLYQYEALQVKLVFAPDDALGRFGGEEDNFAYPRHTLDIAVLRAYRDGKPVRSAHFFPLAERGATEGQAVFIAGNPGHTERYLPAAQLEYLRDVELPLQAATARECSKVLGEFMLLGVEQRQQALDDFSNWDNRFKVYQGSLDYLRASDFIARRAEQEKAWRKDIAAKPAAQALLKDAFGQVQTLNKELAKGAGTRHFRELPSSRFFGLAGSLNNFADAARGKPPAQVAKMAESFKEFLGQVLPPGEKISLELERKVLAAWLEAAAKSLPPDDAFLRMALQGRSPAQAAARILQDAEPLADAARVGALIARGTLGIEGARVPLLAFLRDVEGMDRKEGIAAIVDVDAKELEERRRGTLARIQRALFAVHGSALPPDACATPRLGWGKVEGYTEVGPASVPVEVAWRTSFQSMVARAELKKQQPPFQLSPRFVKARERLDLAAPFNFVSTADGAPGSSGAPLFNREGQLLGVVFDGNRQEVPSIYSYIQPKDAGRSIAVHGAAIWAGLEHIYGCAELVKELKAAKQEQDGGAKEKQD